jgi:hypothetical protein
MAPVPTLSSQLQARVRALRYTQLSELPVARRKMAATAAEVVAARARVLERTVVILERAKHGALARATKAKAEHLAVVAQGVEGKLEYVFLFPISILRLVVIFLGRIRLTIWIGLRNWRLRLRSIHRKHLLLLLGIGSI